MDIKQGKAVGKAVRPTDEELTHALIAVIWSALDEGVTEDELRAIINNVLDSWSPAEHEN